MHVGLRRASLALGLCALLLGASLPPHMETTSAYLAGATGRRGDESIEWRCMTGTRAAEGCQPSALAEDVPTPHLSATAQSSVPGAPHSLSATVAALTVTLIWQSPLSGGSVDAYVIEVGTAASSSNVVIVDTASTTTMFVGEGVPGIYFVRIRARNGLGIGPASNEVTVVLGGSCASAPPAPSGLTIVSSAGSSVSLAWNAAKGAASYLVEAGTGVGLSNVAQADVGPATSFSATGVPAGTYFVRVRARSSCGVSEPSNEVSFSISGPSANPGSAELLRGVIDAVLYWSGPYSDFGRTANNWLSVWPDGVPVTVRMSSEVDAAAQQAARQFLDSYTALTNGGVTFSVEITPDPMRTVEILEVPANTILVRVLPGFCVGGTGCNTGGPPRCQAPLQRRCLPNDAVWPGRSITTLNGPNQQLTIAHELGHALGFGHVFVPLSADVPRPLMAGAREPRRSFQAGLTDIEIQAIAAVRQAGLRYASQRIDALALGLISPP